MSTPFDELEKMIQADMQDKYSETAIDHVMHPRNMGMLVNPDTFSRFKGPCGDTMEICLHVRNGIIMNASFMTDGCGTSIASGSMVTELAKGKTLGQAENISQQDVLDGLGGLPDESKHCALLAATTLKQAIKNYLSANGDTQNHM